MKPISIKSLAQDSLRSTEYLKGKTRERAMLEFWKGAALTLSHIRHPQYAQVANITTHLVAVRGIREVERLATKSED